jgi:hypothetical protein
MHAEDDVVPVKATPVDETAAAPPQPPQHTAEDVPELELDLHAYIIACTDVAEVVARFKPGREIALVRTKLEEAEMWLLKALGEEVSR